MDANKTLYVPDTKKWTMFYMQVGNGDVNPYTNHTMKGYQRRGGLRNKTSPYMLSIDNYTRRASGRDVNHQIHVTSPAEQVVEQAKSEIKRDKTIEKGKRVMKRASQKLSDKKNGPTAKRSKIVKLKSDVFGLY
jgi:hypothetical protein